MPTATARTTIPAGRYAAHFAAWSLGLFALLRLGWIEAHGVLPLTRLQGQIAGRLGGLDTLPVDVTLACSAADAMALCLGAVLAYPATWRMRLAGIAGGLALILTLNTARIATLGRAAASPYWFDLLHVYAWPALLLLAIAGYVFGWMRLVDRPQAVFQAAAVAPAPSRDTLVTWPLVAWTALFLVLFTIAAPWYLQNTAVLATAAFMARAAAFVLRAAGLDAVASGNLLTTTRGSVLVTQECITTPLIPVTIGAIFAYARTWRARAPWLLAVVPVFIALGIARLLVVVLPPMIVASPLFLVHAFYQLVLAAVVVFLAATWRHGLSRVAVQRTLAGYACAVLFVSLLGPIYTRGIMWGFAMPPAADPQGALALLPAFQVGLFLALCATVFLAFDWKRVLMGLVVLASWQIAGLAALQFIFRHWGMTPQVRDVRALALAGPLLLIVAWVHHDRPRR
ncbi:MAG: hypothetical protein JJE40_17190 [Vicinamibacteria bacterium]|nr:hypothetical protein [Vicinamibacteria bacterium]